MTTKSDVPLWKTLRDRGVSSAQELLAEIGVNQAPIDVNAIARVLGVEVAHTHGASWSGILQSEESPPRARVWIDVSEANARIRFTLAHELGHLFLDPIGVSYRDTGGPPYTPSERAANRFAAELLMPRHLVVAHASLSGRSPDVLASVFDVSPNAMAWRLKNLGMG